MDRDPHDETLSRALHDVTVPAGLAERLLARLATESTESTETAQVVPVPSERPARRRWSRWAVGLCGGTVVAAVTLLLLLARLTPLAQVPTTPEQLAALAITWHQQLTNAWNDGQVAAPAGYERDRHVRARQPRWQTLVTPWDRHAVAYELADDGHAWLYVQRAAPSFLEDDAPSQRLPSTGGWSVGAWRRGTTLYVVTTNDRFWRLEDFIDQQSRSLARRGHKPGRFAS